MLEAVSKILYLVSSSALVPVIVALLALAGYTLLMFGGFLSEMWARQSARRWISTCLRSWEKADPDGHAALQSPPDSASRSGFLPRYLRAAHTDASARANLVDEIELEMTRAVANLSTIARIGPMLGLAGTLIPLGPGLVSLAQGQVAALAGQLVIAFSTTVVGLLVGMTCYACAQVRRNWYARDLARILHLEQLRTEPGVLIR